jgi:hypothetical protein
MESKVETSSIPESIRNAVENREENFLNMKTTMYPDDI